jgi:malate dehydrogenase (oxaloacetate-decarboxylating)(NADP+)
MRCASRLSSRALDVGATEINDAMKIGCVEGMPPWPAPPHPPAAAAYQGEQMTFGVDYLIPKPDPRLMGVVAFAVSRLQWKWCGDQTVDLPSYKAAIGCTVFKSAMLMWPVFF